MASNKENLEKMLLAAYKCRQDYLSEYEIEAYRLSNPEENNLGVAIDQFANNSVVSAYQSLEDKDIKLLTNVLTLSFGSEGIFFKDRSKKKLILPASEKKEITLKENGKQFIINLSDYLDVGLFADLRKARCWVEQNSLNKRVLNCFAYSGSFSVYAAFGQASEVVSVDLSKAYCKWIKRNFELNRLESENYKIFPLEIFSFFKMAKKKKLLFDLIIIDPPTFSRSPKGIFSVQKDHLKLLNSAADILSQQGQILFSNNFKEFKLDRTIRNDFLVKNVSSDMQTTDFGKIHSPRTFLISKL